MKEFLKKIFSPFMSDKTIQSLTYYIPGPPPRKSGYREGQFDSLLNTLLQKGKNQGLTLRSYKLERHQSAHQSGVWVFILFEGPRETLEDLFKEWENKDSYQLKDSQGPEISLDML